MAPSPPRRLRVLCLHGFRTNQKIMQDQTRDLRAVLGPNAEFVFLNGPHEANGASDAIIEKIYAAHKPFFEWWLIPANHEDVVFDAKSVAGMTKSAAEKAGPANEWSLTYDGLPDTVQWVHEQIQKLGPFDIAVAFSQATVVLTSLVMWYCRQFDIQLPWKLSICIGGMRVRGTTVRHLFVTEGAEQLVPIPSIHITSKKDPLYEESHKLAQMYEERSADGSLQKLVIEHDGGHRFPSLKRDPAAYDAIVRSIEQHCLVRVDPAARL